MQLSKSKIMSALQCRKRLYLETMESLLAGIEKYIVSSDIDLEGYDIRVFDKALSSDAAVQD